MIAGEARATLGIHVVEPIPDRLLAAVARPEVAIIPVMQAAVLALLFPHEASVQVGDRAVAVVAVIERHPKLQTAVIGDRHTSRDAVILIGRVSGESARHRQAVTVVGRTADADIEGAGAGSAYERAGGVKTECLAGLS